MTTSNLDVWCTYQDSGLKMLAEGTVHGDVPRSNVRGKLHSAAAAPARQYHRMSFSNAGRNRCGTFDRGSCLPKGVPVL
jgi:hypothetical protein